MNDVVRAATTAAMVAAGVILAGIILDSFPDAPLISQARAGYRGV